MFVFDRDKGEVQSITTPISQKQIHVFHAARTAKVPTDGWIYCFVQVAERARKLRVTRSVEMSEAKRKIYGLAIPRFELRAILLCAAS